MPVADRSQMSCTTCRPRSRGTRDLRARRRRLRPRRTTVRPRRRARGGRCRDCGRAPGGSELDECPAAHAEQPRDAAEQQLAGRRRCRCCRRAAARYPSDRGPGSGRRSSGAAPARRVGARPRARGREMSMPSVTMPDSASASTCRAGPQPMSSTGPSTRSSEPVVDRRHRRRTSGRRAPSRRAAVGACGRSCPSGDRHRAGDRDPTGCSSAAPPGRSASPGRARRRRARPRSRRRRVAVERTRVRSSELGEPGELLARACAAVLISTPCEGPRVSGRRRPMPHQPPSRAGPSTASVSGRASSSIAAEHGRRVQLRRVHADEERRSADRRRTRSRGVRRGRRRAAARRRSRRGNHGPGGPSSATTCRAARHVERASRACRSSAASASAAASSGRARRTEPRLDPARVAAPWR